MTVKRKPPCEPNVGSLLIGLPRVESHYDQKVQVGNKMSKTNGEI